MPLPPTSIHRSAVISPEAQIGNGVEVGAGCVLTGKVTLGDGVKLIGNVYIEGPVTIGDHTIVYPFACIGFPPQDFKFKLGSATAGVVIGRECLVREHVTIHAASKLDKPTTVGDKCFLMVNSHLGHDTVIGNNIVLVNAVLLAGHVRVGDNVTMGGNAAIHQFCRVGRFAFVSGAVGMSMDVPPFCIAGGRNTLVGLNLVGLRRGGVPRNDITLLRKAFRAAFYERLPREEMVACMADLAEQSPYVKEFRDFIADRTGKAIAPARFSGAEEEEPANA